MSRLPIQLAPIRIAAAAILSAVIAGAAVSVHAAPRDPRYPDWPCQQLKVPQLSVGSIWTGPSIEGVDKSRRRDAEEIDLVERLAARRTSMDEARKLIADFLTGTPDEKKEKGRLLFADLFDKLNSQRISVMDGIERFSRKEKNLAEAIRQDAAKMRDLQDTSKPDEAKVADLGKQIEWNTRVFEDRRKSTVYVCEVPTIIERRLYGLAQAILQAAK